MEYYLLMSHTVKLSDDLVEQARIYSAAQNRSVPGQIEYWAKLGRTAEENPDLPIEFIKSLFVAMEEAKNGQLTPFKFE